MKSLSSSLARAWTRVGPELLPFADVATDDVPLSRLLRLALFQVSVGMAVVLLTGTLNRVMIVELAIPAWFVAVLVGLPLLFAPLRALIGFRSDIYRSALGWRRIPFIWIGTLLQFGGLAIMPFALLILSGDTTGPIVIGKLAAGLAFLLIGAGLHTTQTAGLALATDLAPESARPRVVALLFVMLLIGMFFASVAFAWLLDDFSQLRLIQVIQGAAVVTLLLNVIALWKQEPRTPAVATDEPRQRFSEAWKELKRDRRTPRLLVAVALGTGGFAMQDILLEPFGGEVLQLSVGGTAGLTALLAGGMLFAFFVAARRLNGPMDANRLAAYGVLVGIVAFATVSFVSVLQSTLFFCIAVALIGFGNGLFAVGTLTCAMELGNRRNAGLALGAWGAVQATAAGVAIAAGGALRDLVGGIAESGGLGVTLASPVTGYVFVYQVEIVLLFVTLAAIGPLAAFTTGSREPDSGRFGIAELPG